MKKRKTLLIYYLSLGICMGGIENYLLNLIMELKSENKNNRIIMIMSKKNAIKPEYQDVLCQVEKVYIKNTFDFMPCEKIKFSDDEEVLALTFYLVPFMQIEMLKKKYTNIKIHNICWVPHFDPCYVFPDEETWVPNILKLYLYNGVRRVVLQLEKNNNIFYLNKRHLGAFEDHYKYTVEEADKKIAHCFSYTIPDFDTESICKKYDRDDFNILSVGRFEFPHKGYILGLVDVFCELKSKYPQLTLTLVGDGADKTILDEKINSLPENVQKDILLPGTVVGDALNEYSYKAKVCVNVAGALNLLSSKGIVSIQARLYSNSCECYGFYNIDNSEKNRLSVEVGENIRPYIERVINATKKEYLELCKESYNAVKNRYNEGSVLDIMDFENVDPCMKFSRADMNIFKLHHYAHQIYIRTIGRAKRLLKKIFNRK